MGVIKKLGMLKTLNLTLDLSVTYNATFSFEICISNIRGKKATCESTSNNLRVFAIFEQLAFIIYSIESASTCESGFFQCHALHNYIFTLTKIENYQKLN